MSETTPRLLVLVSLVALVALPLCAQDSDVAGQTLRLNFEAETSFKMRMRLTQDIEMDAGGMTQETSVDQEMVMLVRVDEVDDEGNARILNRIETLKVDAETPTGADRWNSEEDEEPTGQVSSAVAPLVGADVFMTVTPMGETSDLDAGTLGPDLVKSMTESAFIKLPEKPIAIGDTWETEKRNEIPNAGTLVMTIVSKYEGIEESAGKRCYKISMTFEAAFEKAKDAVMDMEVELDDESVGLTYIDIETGFTVRGDSHILLTMKITAGPQRLVQTLDQTAEIRAAE